MGREWAMVSLWVLALFAWRCDEASVSTKVTDEGATSAFTLESCPVPCEEDPSKKMCVGDVLLGACSNGFRTCEDCAATGKMCVENLELGEAHCALRTFLNPECIPECDGVVCGADGCGGSCGFCPEGGICDAGVCWEKGASCDESENVSWCIGDILATCTQKSLGLLNCSDLGRLCLLNPNTGKLECMVP